ncbi:hypothetical protein EV426DRAFT_611905 [Tirmania nivea]|nr:hypothetical protein EV426DRAFT_611905 [Tirmania nivea]
MVLASHLPSESASSASLRMMSTLMGEEPRWRAGATELSEKDKVRKESKSVKRQRPATEDSGDEKPLSKRERKDSSTNSCSHCKAYRHTQETCNSRREQNARRPRDQQQKQQQQPPGHSHGKFRGFSNQSPIKRPPGRPPRSTIKMTNRFYEAFEQAELSDSILQAAADLFSSNYGIWGAKAAETVGTWAEKGNPVRIHTGKWLKSRYLPAGSRSTYVRVTVDGKLAGHVICSRWSYKNQNICWITQLVVSREFRERKLAYGLLDMLKSDEDDIYGVASSHAAACITLANVFGNGFKYLDLDYIRDNASGILASSPIEYLRTAKLSGSLFSELDNSGLICGVDTNFFVDHTEPLQALKEVRRFREWPLGDLIDGCEFLVIVQAKNSTNK